MQAGGKPGELCAAPVQERPIDQLALFGCRFDGSLDLCVAHFAKPDPSGLLLQGGSGEHRLPLAELVTRLSDGANCGRSEEHTSELQSLMRISYAVFCLKKKTQ